MTARDRRYIALAASALIVAVAGCTSGNGAARPGSTLSPSANPRVTSPRATVIRISATQETWTLPAPVSRSVVLPDHNGFVILGGLSTGDISASRIVKVDPASGDSRVAGHLAAAVHDSAGAVIGGRFYVFGGGSASSIPAVEDWRSGLAAEVASLPVARSDLSAATVNGTTYIVGGYDGSAMTPAVLATTDGTSFRPVARLAVPVRYAAVAGLGSTLWVVGGVTSTSESGSAETDAVEKVDLASGRVTVVARLPQPMGHAAALILDGQIFVLGGRTATGPSAAIFRLDQATGAMVHAGRLPRPVSDAGAVVVDGVGYLVGGESAGPAEPLTSVVLLRPRP